MHQSSFLIQEKPEGTSGSIEKKVLNTWVVTSEPYDMTYIDLKYCTCTEKHKPALEDSGVIFFFSTYL